LLTAAVLSVLSLAAVGCAAVPASSYVPRSGRADFTPMAQYTVRLDPSAAHLSAIVASVTDELSSMTGVRFIMGPPATATEPVSGEVLVRVSLESCGASGCASTSLDPGVKTLHNALVTITPWAAATMASAVTTLRHEFGHVVGLTHFGDGVMRAITTDYNSWSAMDRAALAEVRDDVAALPPLGVANLHPNPSPLGQITF
jgi:hypothetical protein